MVGALAARRTNIRYLPGMANSALHRWWQRSPSLAWVSAIVSTLVVTSVFCLVVWQTLVFVNKLQTTAKLEGSSAMYLTVEPHLRWLNPEQAYLFARHLQLCPAIGDTVLAKVVYHDYYPNATWHSAVQPIYGEGGGR